MWSWVVSFWCYTSVSTYYHQRRSCIIHGVISPTSRFFHLRCGSITSSATGYSTNIAVFPPSMWSYDVQSHRHRGSFTFDVVLWHYQQQDISPTSCFFHLRCGSMTSSATGCLAFSPFSWLSLCRTTFRKWIYMWVRSPPAPRFSPPSARFHQHQSYSNCSTVMDHLMLVYSYFTISPSVKIWNIIMNMSALGRMRPAP